MIEKVTITDSLQKEILVNKDVKSWLEKLSEKIDIIDNIQELYIDYSITNKAIRADILVKNNVLIMLRHIIDDDKDDIVSYSISLGKIVMEVNWCGIEKLNDKINENKKKYNW